MYLFAAFLYGMAQVACFRNTVRQTLKNALLLPVAEPVRTLGILLIPVTAVCLTILFPPFAFLAADDRLLGRRLRDGVPLPQRLRPPPA